MSRNGDVVVVSVNHRLNILGYFDLSDFGEEYANSGNAGTDDLVAALRWIRGNIASFGGDPDNVTLFGQSGGGAKITALLQTPEADGLFAKGIIMSGVIGSVLTDVEESVEIPGRGAAERAGAVRHTSAGNRSVCPSGRSVSEGKTAAGKRRGLYGLGAAPQ